MRVFQAANRGQLWPGTLACIRLRVLKMPPVTFCRDALDELAMLSPNDGWVRGAYALCEMYAATAARRFETILLRLRSARVAWR